MKPSWYKRISMKDPFVRVAVVLESQLWVRVLDLAIMRKMCGLC